MDATPTSPTVAEHCSERQEEQRSAEARVVDAAGDERTQPLPADLQVALWARCLHDGAPGLVEVAAGRRAEDGALRMRSRSDRGRYPPAGDQAALVRLAREHRERGDEVFCTPLTRGHPLPGRAGKVTRGAVCWVDIDEPEGVERLRRFPHRPHLVVWSGSGGAHAYWRLASNVSAEEVEALNRKLCGPLLSDLASTDRARIMRLPGTYNAKAGRPCVVAYLDLARPAFAAEELGAGFDDPDPPPPPPDAGSLRRRVERLRTDGAKSVPPPEYFRLLAGVGAPDGGGLIPCPLPGHEEEIASCMVYAEANQGWTCFGCGRGGTIYDLASLVQGGPSGRALRGEEFNLARRFVRERLGGRATWLSRRSEA